ncbi:MAG: HEAT repeat domain-containing protein [Planctomycetota bacterium]|jgi:hypothetical protein
MSRFRPFAPAAFLILALCVSPTWADARGDFMPAHQKLQQADFDELPVAERDRLFAVLGAWDNPGAVKLVAEIIARYATYMDVIEYRLAQTKEKLAKFMTKSAMTDQAIALRNSYLKKVEVLEQTWRDANKSLMRLVKAMGAWKDTKTLSMAVGSLPSQPTWRVRSVAALAAAEWHKKVQSDSLSKRLFSMLQQLAKDKEPGVRRDVARSIGAFRRAEAVPILKKCMNDGDWRVRAAAIAAVRKTPSDDGVTLLIARLKKEKGRLADDIVQALTAITGQKLRWVEQWEGWWNGVDKHIPPKGSTPADIKAIRKKKDDSNRFYGIPTRSQRICFIIDMSGSMDRKTEELKKTGPITGKKETDQPVAGKTRWEVAQNELKRAVRGLNSRAFFEIVFFNHSVKPWKTEMVKASPDNKKAAIDFIDRVKPRGATYTLGALRQAFSIAGAETKKGTTKREGPKVDTIFLLSDGGPTDATMDGPSKPMEPDPIIEQVNAWNKDLGVVIHCIAVHTDEIGTYFLKQLASQNGGQFVARK